jgi:hypothetical protein
MTSFFFLVNFAVSQRFSHRPRRRPRTHRDVPQERDLFFPRETGRCLERHHRESEHALRLPGQESEKGRQRRESGFEKNGKQLCLLVYDGDFYCCVSARSKHKNVDI